MVEHEPEDSPEEIDEETRYRLYEKAYDNDSNLISINSSDFNKAIRYFAATLIERKF